MEGMKKIFIILSAVFLLSCSETVQPAITVETCDKKTIVSSHFADLPLPENTCPFAQATNGTTIEQKFTIVLPYKDATAAVTTKLTNAGYTIQEQPETTIGTQKTWSAQVQKNSASQNIYTLTITNQNPTTLEKTTGTAFLTIQEQNLGG